MDTTEPLVPLVEEVVAQAPADEPEVELPPLGAPAQDFLRRYLAGDPTITTPEGVVYRLQWSFAATASIGAIELPAPDAGVGAVISAALQLDASSIAAALKRHHPAATDDDIDDVCTCLGGPWQAYALCRHLAALWRDTDRLGPYYAGADPHIRIGTGEVGRVLRLRFGPKAIRNLAAELAAMSAGDEALTPARFKAIAAAALSRFHPDLCAEDHVLDDLGATIGLRGLARLMGGAEQPRRPDLDEDAGPNPEAGAEPTQEAGTGASSSS